MLDIVVWPMGAELASEDKIESLLESDEYIADCKYAGERLVLTKYSNDRVTLTTRSAGKFSNNKPIDVTHRWPQIIDETDWSRIPDGTVLDGEGWSPLLEEEAIAGLFNHRSSVPMPDHMKYIVFDTVYENGESLENLQWIERRDHTEVNVLKLSSPFIVESSYTKYYKREFIEGIWAEGGEGAVLKRLDSTYSQGKKPAGQWVKVKRKETYDCIIAELREGQGKLQGMVGAIGLAQYRETVEPNGLIAYNLVDVGSSHGLPFDMREHMFKHPQFYLGRVVVVDSLGRSSNGKLKKATVKYIRPEGSKDPRDCVFK